MQLWIYIIVLILCLFCVNWNKQVSRLKCICLPKGNFTCKISQSIYNNKWNGGYV